LGTPRERKFGHGLPRDTSAGVGAAESLFDEIAAGQYARIAEFVREPRAEENLYLEFKRSSTESGVPTGSDLKNYSKALSGFANSDGGVIVWGVSCPQPESETAPDVAEELAPIRGHRVFQTTLNAKARTLVHRPVDGIRNEAIADLTTDDVGFVVSLIPASEVGPHRAEFGDVKGRHFKRNASNFILMENFELEDMFGRRRRPKLKVRFEFHEKSNAAGFTTRFGVDVFVCNVGYHPAQHVAVRMLGSRFLPSWQRGSLCADLGGGLFAMPGEHVLHPETEAVIAHADCIVPDRVVEDPLMIQGTAFALGATPVPFVVSYDRKGLEAEGLTHLPSGAFLRIHRT
jgi:hypothetical protein